MPNPNPNPSPNPDPTQVSFSDVLAYDYSGAWNEGTTVAAGRTEARPAIDYGAPPTHLASAGSLLWQPAATVFTITILQASCPGCTPMPGLASVRPASDTEIKTRSHSSSRAFGVSPLLAGDFGKRVGPSIIPNPKPNPKPNPNPNPHPNPSPSRNPDPNPNQVGPSIVSFVADDFDNG